MRRLPGAGGVRRLSPVEMEARERARTIVSRAEARVQVISRVAFEAAVRADEDRVVELVLDATRALWRRDAEADVAVVRDAVRRAVARVCRARCLVLRVHPGDVGAVRAAAREWLPEGAEPETLDVVGDGAVERGGVIVESELGRADATLDATLGGIAALLRREAST